MRKIGWEKRLREVIENHAVLPSQYGVSDCYLLANDAHKALTGENIGGVRVNKYKTEVGAAKQLRKLGFNNIEEAFAAHLSDVPVMMAQRGDLGVAENENGEICAGVFTAIGFAAKPQFGGIQYLPIDKVKRAFQVR